MENKIDSYKIFESVARNESISKASEELFISQPAVSQSIKKLEETIGGELFSRTKLGVRLTSEGKIFYEYIKNGLDFIENGERVFSSLKNLDVGSIRIGASATLTRHILLPYLKQFHCLFPNIDIEIVNNLSPNLLTMLKNGMLDLLILNLPIGEQNDLEIVPFTKIQDAFYASPFYMRVENAYSLQDLENYKMICQKRPSHTRKYFDEFIKNKNIKINPHIEAVSFNIVCDLTKIGLGYSFLTREFVKTEIESGEIVELKVETLPEPREVGIVYSKRHTLSFATKQLIDIILKNNAD